MSDDDYQPDDYSYDYQGIEQTRIFTIVIATMSVLFPLSVVIILIQKYDTLVRGRSLVHYVLCIAIADTIAAFFLAFGYPYAGTVACSMQGFITILTQRFSWFYTDVLMIQLFSVVVFKQYLLNVKYMHGIVWSLNLLLQFIPFTTGAIYGSDDQDGIPIITCLLTGGEGKYDGDFWMQYTANIEILVSFSIIIILSIVIVYFSLKTSTSAAYLAPRIKESWSLVILYPLAMLIAFLPSQIYAFYLNQRSNNGHSLPIHGAVIFNYLLAFSSLYGVFLSIIFYTKTLEARRAWLSNWRYLQRMITKDSEVNKDTEDDDVRCSSIISIDDRVVSEIRMTSLRNHSNDQSGSGSVVNPMKNSISINSINSHDTTASIRIPEA